MTDINEIQDTHAVPHQHELEGVAKKLLQLSGDSAERGGLLETPKRFAKAFGHWTSGYGRDPAAVLKAFEDGAEQYDQMVVLTNIPVWSLCEHHMAPFFGVAHIGYIPDKRVVGLSKLPRLVEVFAKRFQVQERLTQEIADALYKELKPLGVGVRMECRHSCMESRGIQVHGVSTHTTSLQGTFRDMEVRTEFFTHIPS